MSNEWIDLFNIELPADFWSDRKFLDGSNHYNSELYDVEKYFGKPDNKWVDVGHMTTRTLLCAMGSCALPKLRFRRRV